MSQLLEVENLCIDFRLAGGTIRAVDGLSFRVPAGRTVALVGESGSGKSVTAQAIMGILPRVATIAGGAIRFCDPDGDGSVVDIAQLAPDGRALRDLRGGLALPRAHHRQSDWRGVGATPQYFVIGSAQPDD